MTAKELLRKMSEAFDLGAAGDTEATVQYRLSEPMYHTIQAGEMTLYEGSAESPDLTLEMTDEDLVALMTGELGGVSAFMSGKLKVSGDMTLAQRLVGFVDQSKLAPQATAQPSL